MKFSPRNIRNRKGFNFTDFYELLGVSRDADEATIRKAYRRKAKVVHPDRNRTDDGNRCFIALKEAYETLIDPDKRRRYDMWLDHGVSLTLYRVWQQARDNHRRYRTGAYRRRRKRESMSRDIPRESLNWFVNALLVSMLLLSAYTLFISVRELIMNDFKAEQLQGITFSAGFMMLLVYLGLERQRRRRAD